MPLRVLVIEDSEPDAERMVSELERGGYDVVWERVQTAEEMHAALGRATWDLVLSDFDLPAFSGTAPLDVLKHSGHDLPFLIIVGTVDEGTPGL
jgi:CheY-like chemotaxis protein